MNPARPPAKVQITPIRRLSEADMTLLERLEPETVLRMMRQRVNITNHGMVGIANWLTNNAKGLYYRPNDSTIWFEEDEDLVLFIAAFQGKTKG
jgi:1,4-dihydroxy-2-naphthoyl-CoA synthase